MSTDDVHGEPTPVEGRLIDSHCLMLDSPEPRVVAYNHSAFCQMSLPYRNPGDLREVTRSNGSSMMTITAGKIFDKNQKFKPVGLPYGPRARLVLIHLMTQAVLNQSPTVELSDSLTSFAKLLKISTNGQNIKTLREQMLRIAACSIRIGIDDQRGTARREQFQAHIIEKIQMFTPKKSSQQEFWPSYVTLNSSFYDSMIKHAVPLDPRALSALKHSSAALDCYQWLAQRLYRANTKGRVVPWNALYSQLGGSHKRISDWKRTFTGHGRKQAGVLPQVLMVYPAANDSVEVTERGLLLKRADPPVPQWGRIQRGRYLT